MYVLSDLTIYNYELEDNISGGKQVSNLGDLSNVMQPYDHRVPRRSDSSYSSSLVSAGKGTRSSEKSPLVGLPAGRSNHIALKWWRGYTWPQRMAGNGMGLL